MIKLPEMKKWTAFALADAEQQIFEYLIDLGFESISRRNLKVEYNSVYDFWDCHLYMDDVVDDIPASYKRAMWDHITSVMSTNTDLDHVCLSSWRWNHHSKESHFMDPTPGIRFWIKATKDPRKEQKKKDQAIDRAMRKIEFDYSRDPQLLREFVAALVDQKII